ncbi:MAG TPA: BamA/TamA family outer membrane protein [Candidatus Binataceae bacterium]|nr:BamA/TamA family outer membrane protein [Candidatus Binataceae bacterium]
MEGTGRAAVFSLTNPNSWPFIPVPEVATDPFAGTTLGLMPVILKIGANQQITSIIAPDLSYNTIMGVGGNLRYLAYPSADTQWFALAGGAQQVEGSTEVDWATGLQRNRWWTLEVHLRFQQDPTFRFFGLGNHSSYRKQSNYSLQQMYADAMFGVNLTRHLQLALREWPRRVRIYHGALPSLPYIDDLFPEARGVNGGSEMLNQLLLTYDTRNSLNVPTTGGLVALFGGLVDRSFMSSSSYSIFTADLRRYLALNNRVILAGQIYARYMPSGDAAPFWAMSWMGGDAPGESSLLGIPISDEQTWRGSGPGRFIDNDMFLMNLEVRIRTFSAELFGTNGIVELAPFMDIGRVYHYVTSNPFSQMHPAGGLGFRAVVLPYVVGYVDMGYGQDGIAVFSGINYPF